MRSRSVAMPAENHRTARMTAPCSQAFGSPPSKMNCSSVTTASPVATITSTPGHQAQKPAKKPQNGPSAFCVHTYSEPSCGNICPSCAVISAPGIRNSRKPRIQYENAAGPAGCTADALTMNSTIAMKITTMSKEPRTRGSMPGAMRSEAITRSFAAAAMPPPPYERTPILFRRRHSPAPGSASANAPVLLHRPWAARCPRFVSDRAQERRHERGDDDAADHRAGPPRDEAARRDADRVGPDREMLPAGGPLRHNERREERRGQQDHDAREPERQLAAAERERADALDRTRRDGAAGDDGDARAHSELRAAASARAEECRPTSAARLAASTGTPAGAIGTSTSATRAPSPATSRERR